MSTTQRALAGQMYVGGRWVGTADTFEVTDPGNGELVARVADGVAEDGLAAVAAADEAAAGWAATAPRERAEFLRSAFELMIERRAEIAELITREMGKSRAESVGEVEYAAEFLRWFAEEAVRLPSSMATAPSGDYQIITRSEPVGVSLLITPWNFPAAMATRKVGAALAAGCPVVLKPAQATPLTSLAIAQIFDEVRLPAGVLNVVTSSSSSAITEPMLADARLRKLSFTGSTEVGRTLLAQCAPRILRTSMELGGNAPFLVLEGADLDAAVDSAVTAKLRNIGQSCVAANRFHVHNSLKTEFAERLAAAMAEQRVGYGLDPEVQVGAMISAEARDAVLGLVQDATERGAELLTGGNAIDGPGSFMEPTVLLDVPADARCVTEEIFGPVAPILGFDCTDEAVAAANGTIFGLVAYVHGPDLGQTMSVADRIEAGMVGINRGVLSDPAAPFGGRKQSGLGREGGHEGLLEYLETKYLCAAW